jgi:hypothetical protein
MLTLCTHGACAQVIMLMPASMADYDMVPWLPGTWMFHCHVSATATHQRRPRRRRAMPQFCCGALIILSDVTHWVRARGRWMTICWAA